MIILASVFLFFGLAAMVFYCIKRPRTSQNSSEYMQIEN
jgi:hypothetical protein